jgi:hypothetical protein
LIERNFHGLPKLQREIALLAIVKAPIEAGASFGSAFFLSLPEVVQCRLKTGRDLDLAALSRAERLRIATTRIDMLLPEDPSNINYAYFQGEFSRLCDAALTFYQDEPHPKAASPELIGAAFDVIQRVVQASEVRQGYPLTTIDLVFYKLITPLAMCYADQQYADRARELSDSACKVLLTSGKTTPFKIEAYRGLFTALEHGATFREAEAQLVEALDKH